MKNVLVTGANGHLGYTISKYLSEKDYNVYAGVRNINDKSKTKLLDKLSVNLVELDITNIDQVQKVVQHVDGVFHTAAVLSLSGKRKDIIGQTTVGAMNIIKAANQCDVKKVIYTSSSRVLGAVSTKEAPLNEHSWNANCKVPYFEAKIISEKEVARYANEKKMNVIYILPSVILGPNINRFSESTDLVRKIMLNKMPVIAPVSFNFVDVRDVALAQIAAYENPQAYGRYIIGNEPIYLYELIEEISKYYVIKKPKIQLNKYTFISLSYIMSLFLPLVGKRPQTSTQQAIEFTKGVRYLDLSKTEKELGIKLRKTSDTIKDTVNYILECGLI